MDYATYYSQPGFEEYQIIYRRKKLSEIMEKYQPKTVLEIGTGGNLFFSGVNWGGVQKYIFVEPNKIFFDSSLELASGNEKVTGYNMYFASTRELKEHKVDFVFCSGVLSEVKEENQLLLDIADICTKDTIVNIVMANANSFHRLIAKEMGLIEDVHDVSERGENLQCHRVYDLQTLKECVEKNGFQVIETGSYFIKPFAHSQMYDMMKRNIIDERVLDGFYKMEKYLPDLGSEIFVNAKLK